MGCLVRIVWGYIKRVGRRWRRKRVKSIGNLSEWKEKKKVCDLADKGYFCAGAWIAMCRRTED